jgi:hypothetical protein
MALWVLVHQIRAMDLLRCHRRGLMTSHRPGRYDRFHAAAQAHPTHVDHDGRREPNAASDSGRRGKQPHPRRVRQAPQSQRSRQCGGVAGFDRMMNDLCAPISPRPSCEA